MDTSMMTRSICFTLFLGLMAVTSIFAFRSPAADSSKETPKFTASQVDFYEKEVKPILVQHCLKCHGAEEKVKGGLHLTTRQAVLAGGDSGPAVMRSL